MRFFANAIGLERWRWRSAAGAEWASSLERIDETQRTLMSVEAAGTIHDARVHPQRGVHPLSIVDAERELRHHPPPTTGVLGGHAVFLPLSSPMNDRGMSDTNRARILVKVRFTLDDHDPTQATPLLYVRRHRNSSSPNVVCLDGADGAVDDVTDVQDGDEIMLSVGDVLEFPLPHEGEQNPDAASHRWAYFRVIALAVLPDTVKSFKYMIQRWCSEAIDSREPFVRMKSWLSLWCTKCLDNDEPVDETAMKLVERNLLFYMVKLDPMVILNRSNADRNTTALQGRRVNGSLVASGTSAVPEGVMGEGVANRDGGGGMPPAGRYPAPDGPVLRPSFFADLSPEDHSILSEYGYVPPNHGSLPGIATVTVQNMPRKHPIHGCHFRFSAPTKVPLARFLLWWEKESQWWHTDRHLYLHEMSWTTPRSGACVATWRYRKNVPCLWTLEEDYHSDSD